MQMTEDKGGNFDNRDVDNILSKKIKPSSSHILEIYFEEK